MVKLINQKKKKKKRWVRGDSRRAEGGGGEGGRGERMRGKNERTVTEGGPVASRSEASCSCHLLSYFYTVWLSR